MVDWLSTTVRPTVAAADLRRVADEVRAVIADGRDVEVRVGSKVARNGAAQMATTWSNQLRAFPLTPTQASALGLDSETLRARNPRLIEVAITPFGSDGPYADNPASDLVQLAMSGYMHMTGEADGRPLRPSAPMQTYLHGSNHAFAAALLALRRRDQTGEGAFIDQSIRNTGLWMLTHTYQHWDMLGLNLKRQGQNRDMGAKKRLRSVFRCKDGFAVLMFAPATSQPRPSRP